MGSPMYGVFHYRTIIMNLRPYPKRVQFFYRLPLRRLQRMGATVIVIQLLLGLASIAFCIVLLKRIRSESFPRGKEFLRVLLGCCGFAALLGIVLH